MNSWSVLRRCHRGTSAECIFLVNRMAFWKPGLQNERHGSRDLRVSIGLHSGCYCCWQVQWLYFTTTAAYYITVHFLFPAPFTLELQHCFMWTKPNKLWKKLWLHKPPQWLHNPISLYSKLKVHWSFLYLKAFFCEWKIWLKAPEKKNRRWFGRVKLTLPNKQPYLYSHFPTYGVKSQMLPHITSW